MTTVPEIRRRAANDAPIRPDGRYILYWMTAFRRLSSNFALQRAVDAARELRKPLVILEALDCDYPWASDRLHTFVIDGMAEHARELARTPVTYLPYVEPRPGEGRGLVGRLASEAALVVADDYPCFFLPRLVAAAAADTSVRVEVVDSNGVLPLRLADRLFVSARSFRAHVQRTLSAALADWPLPDLRLGSLPRPVPLPPTLLRRWRPTPLRLLRDAAGLVAGLPIDHSVGALRTVGGTMRARARLLAFVAAGLPRYADEARHPDAAATSGLSPYLHFGHLSAHQVFTRLMRSERWTPRRRGTTGGGRRDGWWGVSAGANAFLDQSITWRELGFNACVMRPDDYGRFESLPDWARATLRHHARDRRSVLYSREQLEAADTHDEVWNAAQRQLTRDGWMHGYLRMLWGKKILEWSRTPEEALETMTIVMNRWALDGRDPNSYSGYLWTLGKYDRPWGPERPIFGTVRYMSSENTRRKLRMREYLARYGRE